MSLWEPTSVAEQELVLLTGQRGARMAEMQVPPHGEFRAIKYLEVEARGLEHDGKSGSLLTRT